jgi:hypothetical protein
VAACTLRGMSRMGGSGAFAVAVSFCAGAAVAGCAAAGLVRWRRRSKACNKSCSSARPPAYEHPPHAAWTAGVSGSLPSPYEGGEMVALDPTMLDKGSLYSLMVC